MVQPLKHGEFPVYSDRVTHTHTSVKHGELTVPLFLILQKGCWNIKSDRFLSFTYQNNTKVVARSLEVNENLRNYHRTGVKENNILKEMNLKLQGQTH